jgi:hypothetical protein
MKISEETKNNGKSTTTNGQNEECRLVGCGAVWVLLEPTFSVENISPIFRGKRKRKVGTTLITSRCSQLAESSYPEDGMNKFLRNIGSNNTHTVLHPRRRHSS